jgi:hypothetical protein
MASTRPDRAAGTHGFVIGGRIAGPMAATPTAREAQPIG